MMKRNPGPAIVGTGNNTEMRDTRESAICLHTPAVAWNLFHAKATRVGPWQHLIYVVTSCGLKSTLPP